MGKGCRTIFATLFALCLSSAVTAVWAGPVDTNVRICGVTSPYQRTPEDEVIPGFFGNSTTGLKNQWFRVRGYLNLSENSLQGADPRNMLIAEFISALQTRGVRMCVRGNVETWQKLDKTYYYLYPKSYELQEKPTEYLGLGDLGGGYTSEGDKKMLLSIDAANDAAQGMRFFLSVWDAISAPLKGSFGCGGLGMLAEHPDAFTFFPARLSKTALTVELPVISCADAVSGDTLKIKLKLEKASAVGPVSDLFIKATILLDRTKNGETSTFSVELLQASH